MKLGMMYEVMLKNSLTLKKTVNNAMDKYSDNEEVLEMIKKIGIQLHRWRRGGFG